MKKLYLLVVASMMMLTAVAQPTVAAPTPPVRNASKVVSIFSSAYDNVPNANYRPEWGQSTQVDHITIGDAITLKYSRLNYEGTEFAPQNLCDMNYFHIDVYSETTGTVNFWIINKGTGEAPAKTLALKANEWVSFDVPMTELHPNHNAVWQFKMDGASAGVSTIYIQNMYFYQSDATPDTEAPKGITAITQEPKPNSVELKMNGTDNSGALFYEISYTGLATPLVAGGKSGADCVFEVPSLNSGTSYTFTVTAKDRAGNAASAVTITGSTAGDLAVPTAIAPAPTHSADVVKSIYSNHYASFVPWAIGWWGQSTILTEVVIDGKKIMKLDKLNYQGLELNANKPNNFSDMTHLHVDVWTPNSTKFEITPIGGGERLTSCAPLALQKWNSFDFPLSSFAGVNLSGIIQIKIVGDGPSGINVAYVDNLYFYNANGAGVNDVNGDESRCYVTGSTLNIEGANGKSVTVYNVAGQMVKSIESADNVNIDLSNGMYIVRVGDAINKVVVR